jgi:DNA replication licensing factor MCM6
MVITHDKYVELQTMIVLHLAGHEQSTGKGMDREELIDWYLEQRETEMHDIEELEYEKELIVKLLKRLVKVLLSLFFFAIVYTHTERFNLGKLFT